MNGFYTAFKVICALAILMLIHSIYHKELSLIFISLFCLGLSFAGALLVHPSEFKHLKKQAN